MPDPMQSAYTDIPQSEDPVVRAVFEAVNTEAHFYPETTCAEFVKFFRPAFEAMAAEERMDEECGEFIQEIGKILRHGYDSFHPYKPLVTDRQLLGRELTDFYAVASAMCRDKVPEGSLHDQDRAWDRKLRYAHHQEELPK